VKREKKEEKKVLLATITIHIDCKKETQTVRRKEQ
jgi:hypothetical protein